MIEIRHLQLVRGDFRLEVRDFAIPSGSYAVLMGPTGCGKTSFLECIAGLVKPVSGSILLDGRDVTHVPPAGRGIGYVPQDGALFRGLSVRENLGFALRIRRAGEADIESRVAELSELLGIRHLLARQTERLSGGERQRTALGRALAFRPRWLLLDEPLAALDADTHESLCELLKTVHQVTGTTFVHITHSAAEASRLGTLQMQSTNLFTTPPRSG